MNIYGCYGSNLNKDQMAFRCPDAKPLGFVYLKDYALVYNRVASIEERKGAVVPLGIWEISENDEKSLDVYEGYPNYYRKEYFTLVVNGKEMKVMVYIKNDMGNYQNPPENYYNTIKQGYIDFDIDLKYLEESVK